MSNSSESAAWIAAQHTEKRHDPMQRIFDDVRAEVWFADSKEGLGWMAQRQ
jgi:hypothetical protein